MTVKTRKKLIEVALPLNAINTHSVREGYIYRGNPSALHKWWAQRPLAAARAVIFAQMVDDPSSFPDLFPTEKAQEKERQRLFGIIEELVKWENITNETVLQKARDEIWQSWRRACAENADHPRARELFDRHRLPRFHDPFAGGGTLPLEAQRLGLEAYASDLNPVAVLINKAMIEIPPKFADKPPVNPVARAELARGGRWHGTGAQGLAEDVRYYGQWMRDEAEKRIGHLYPKIEITADVATERPDLKSYVGQKLTVIAWLWARTVKSPNPAFANVDVPLASTFMLSTKAGKESYVEPIIDGENYRFTVKTGKPKDAASAKRGTKSGASGSSFSCLMSGVPMQFEYLRAEAKAGRMSAKLMAVVAESPRGRIYLSPTAEIEQTALNALPDDPPDTDLPTKALGFRVQEYGMSKWRDLFTSRQLVALTTVSDLVAEVISQVRTDALDANLPSDGARLADGGTGAMAYAEGVGVYLAFAQDKAAEYGCTIVPWYSKEDRPKGLFARHAIPMVWDFAEVNPLCDIGGSFSASVGIVAGALAGCVATGPKATASQIDAVRSDLAQDAVVSTDPPYYDNIGYADLSDFFYVWLRRSLRPVFPVLFATVAVPKAEELVATPYRHGTKDRAEAFFLEGMTQAMRRLADQAHPAFPVTIYYAFKQSENETDAGTASTGWETFLDAVIRAGFGISGTWPIRTERGTRSIGLGTNALASSIVLVCRQRAATAVSATRREFVGALKTELPAALRHLQAGNIAPVDLAQAAIGPGMAVYTRYARVVDAEGKPVSVREALALINATLDEALAEQEGDFDADSRWALAWFEQNGFAEGEYGVAETLSKAKNTSVAGLAASGILDSKRGKVRLLKPEELPASWDPATDPRFTSWEVVHHLIRVLGSGGESASADLVAKLGARAESARELAYRLYTICERKKRATEALSYNGLVQSWPEIIRLVQEGVKPAVAEPDLFNAGER
jgi:putative DNA methylase